MMKIRIVLPLALVVVQICVISGYFDQCTVACEIQPHRDYQKKLLNQKIYGEKDELELLFVIHRHGDRSPTNFPPSDTNKEQASEIWPMGLGTLTKAGRQRMFRLGKYLRRRYSPFLTLDPSEVYSASSDVDRCIESAQLVLAGLYKPADNWIWSDGLQWQPVAVHTQPQYDDSMLNLFSFCPVRSIERNKFLRSEGAFKDVDGINTGLKQNYGYTSIKPIDYINAYITFYIENQAQLPMKHWLVADSNKNFKRLASLAHKAQTLFSHNLLLKKLSSGVLINDIITKMYQYTEGRHISKMKKLYHYSTHDTNINALLDTLGLIGAERINEIPQFGCTVMIELRKGKPTSSENAYTVKLFYLNNTEDEDNDLKEIPLAGCLKKQQQECTLENFDNFTKMYRLTPGDWHQECGRS